LWHNAKNGDSFDLEKSKVEMIKEDVGKALKIIWRKNEKNNR